MSDADLIIKNGRIVDPARGIDTTGAVAVKNRKIIPYADGLAAKTEVDASGCVVTPGLIDFHAHIYDKGTDSGINPDISMLPAGVTAVVDAGSSGVSTYRALLDRLSSFEIKSKIYLQVAPTGQVTHQFPEPIRPDTWDMEKFASALETGGDKILGFKLRISKSVLGGQGLEPFYKALDVAGHFGRSAVIHVTDPPSSQSEVADALRPGDIFCHVYHGTGSTILDGDGKKILPEVLKARERGVLFDACHGSANFSFGVAERAMKLGFYPDLISTDITTRTWCKKPVYSLPHVMSKFLMYDMSLSDIIAAVTSTPAKIMRMEEEIGSLAPGSCADIAVLRVKNQDIPFSDCHGVTRKGSRFFAPQMTVLNGTIVAMSCELWQ